MALNRCWPLDVLGRWLCLATGSQSPSKSPRGAAPLLPRSSAAIAGRLSARSCSPGRKHLPGLLVGSRRGSGGPLPPREFAVYGDMDKLVQFGRKAWFVVRVMSGYEQRRIRSYRLQLQQRLEQAQAKKEEVRKQPEQVILSEVRQVVQQMQALKQHFEEAETAIEKIFNPIDKNAQMITDMQMEKEEAQAKEMAKVMREQIKMQRELSARTAEATAVEPNNTLASETTAESLPKQETGK